MFSHLLLSSVLLLSNLSAVRPAEPLDDLCPAFDKTALPLPSEEAKLDKEQADLEKKVKTDVDKAKRASCSGVNCGCDVDQQWCYADCPPEGEEGARECRIACARAYIACARACCEGW